MSEEDLKTYWKNKESSSMNDSFSLFVYAKRTIIVLTLFLAFYFSLHRMKLQEDENNFKLQRKLQQQHAAKSDS